jgi:hypothetical protein
MAQKLPRPPLIRVNFGEDFAGLPPSLIAAVELEGGLWWASDAHTSADEVITAARSHDAVGLRLDFRDLSLLKAVPSVKFLHLRTDGRPFLDPIGVRADVRALVVQVGAMRGELDPSSFPNLRWLRVPLGGKGGAAILPAVMRGHPRLEWLALRETRARTVGELCSSFPELRVLRISFADYLRELGQLSDLMPRLRKLTLDLTQVREINGLANLRDLETLELVGGRVRDVTPLAFLPNLRYARLDLPDLESIEPLRNHPSLRMVALTMAREPDPSVLESIRGLTAVRTGRNFTRPVQWPDLNELQPDHPLRVEWSLVMRE